ncbi:MAG: hypothetical protein AAFY88_03720, partial [Acidobacteriota bacterium]
LAMACLDALAEPWRLGVRRPKRSPIVAAAAVVPVGPRQTRRGLEISTRLPPSGAPGVATHRELTLQLDAESSFCQLAVVDLDDGGDGLRGGRWSSPRCALEEALDGPLLGVAGLRGVIDVGLGVRGDDGGRRLEIRLPAPLRPSAAASVRAPRLVEWALDDLEISALGAVGALGALGALGAAGAVGGELDGDGRVLDAFGGLGLRGAFVEALLASNDPSPAPEVQLAITALPRIDDVVTDADDALEGAVHIDLQLRASWSFRSTFSLPVPDGRGGRRRLETGPARLLLFVRLTTLSEAGSAIPLEPQRRPSAPALSGGARRVEMPTLAVLDGHYDLHADELGGAARDERRLVGLTRLDLGEPVGHLQPTVLTLESPTVARGGRRLLGFDGNVRFPRRLWRRKSPTWRHLAPSLGVVDRQSGRFLGGLQLAGSSSGLPDAVECRLEAGARLTEDAGQLRLELVGGCRVDLDAGMPFTLSGARGELKASSSVRFALRLEATGSMESPTRTLSGEERLVSSNRQLFTYRYVLPPRPGERILFEYTNHSTGGTFQMTCPLRLLFARSPDRGAGRGPDTVILEGLGRWRDGERRPKDAHDSGELRHVIFVSRRSKTAPYVAILVDGGAVSNVEAGDA